MMKVDFRANFVERAVIFYLIEAARDGATFQSLNKDFLLNPLVRGTTGLWQNIMGSIRGQLSVSPDDKQGFSITPKWVREVYCDYWKTPNPHTDYPNKINLEGLNKTECEFNRKENIPKKCFGYCTKQDMPEIIRLFPIKDEGLSYYRGFLKAAKAKKWYRVTLEELEIDTEQDE